MRKDGRMAHLLTAATSPQAQAQGAQVSVLPVGSFEQHSDFLPLITDTVVACVIAQRLSDDYSLFLLPPVTFGCSHEHARFAGTVSVSAATLIAVISDIRDSLAAQGIHHLVIVNGHGGNYVLSNVAQEANIAHAASCSSQADPTGTPPAKSPRWRPPPATTCTPANLRSPSCRTPTRTSSAPATAMETGHVNPRPHLLTTGMDHYTPTGVIGRPSLGISPPRARHSWTTSATPSRITSAC